MGGRQASLSGGAGGGEGQQLARFSQPPGLATRLLLRRDPRSQPGPHGQTSVRRRATSWPWGPSPASSLCARHALPSVTAGG